MSKKHHPDRNPNDPQAADRFVKISEAYHVLGSAEKRARYDRDFLRTSQPHHPSGSYSSTGPAGGRPATGLSRRRTQFKGPPPSFYRNGGWGHFSEKRSEHASKASHAHEAAGSSSAQDAPGTGPSGFTSGFDNDVRHFDREGHFRTHDAVQRNRHRARRRTGGVDAEVIVGSSTMLSNFVLLSGVLTVIFSISGILFRKPEEKKKL